jgi:hypothetical protein
VIPAPLGQSLKPARAPQPLPRGAPAIVLRMNRRSFVKRTWPRRRRALIASMSALGAMLVSLVAVASSAAAMVTVGPTLPRPWAENFSIACDSCVLTNPVAPESGSDISPVSGVILNWRLYRGMPAEPSVHPGYRLRVLTPQGAGYVGAGRSARAVPLHLGALETFSTHLPVKAGQLIGLEAENEDSTIRFGSSTSATSVFLEPAVGEGQFATSNPWWENGFVFLFNAEVLPSPAVTGISPTSGPLAGGTEVTLFGKNFAELESVSVGGSLVGYSVDSESELTIKMPASASAASVPIAVTTAAGRAELPSAYTYADANPVIPPRGCVVPKLKGRSLAAAKSVLSQRNCKLGKVRHGAREADARIKRQAPAPQTALPAGGMVKVTMSAKRTRAPQTHSKFRP